MKKILLSFLIAACCSMVHGQNPNIEKLNAYKVGFFTKKLDLSASEAQKFWPVYNEYQEGKIRIQTERLGLVRTFNQTGSTMNDEQIIRLSDRLVESQVAETELAVKFHEMLKQVLPPAKVIRYYQAENQYKAYLLNELQNRQPNRGGQPGNRSEIPE